MPFNVAELPSIAAQLPDAVSSDTTTVLRKRDRSSICSGVLKARTDEDAEDEKQRLWVTALNKWLLVLRLVDFSGTVGSAVQSAGSEEARHSIIRDVLGTRSPRTAIKRADSILRWLKWAFQAGYEIWPPTAAGLRNFLTDDGSISVAPSACGALLEALRFCKHVLHMVVPDDALKDPIVIGRCARMMAEKQVVKQARPLLVREVEKLERFMSGDNEPWDIYMVGCCLFAIFSRSRWSDLEYMDELYVDRSDDYPTEVDGAGELFGFVEGRTRRHKGATTVIRKRRQMPIVSPPLLGVSGLDWTAAWMESMVAVGFDVHARPLGALCRPPLPNGQLARGSCSSEDIGAFLTRLLELPDQDAIASHSMKATTLAWAAKFGIDESARLLLGHHSVGGRSLATYSRDMLGRPLMIYSGMLASIRSGQFQPDMTRSGWLAPVVRVIATQAGCPATPMAPTARTPGTPMVGASAATPAVVTAEVEEPVDDTEPAGGDDKSTCSSRTSSSSSEDTSELEEEIAARMMPQPERCEVPGPLFQHTKSRVLHRPGKADHLLLCGRRNSGYRWLPDGASMQWARCHFCFRGEVMASREQMADRLESLRVARD